jgi:CRISPR/Cas system CMR subunit Cmr4 (Cas7 group RAMP superfamily)
MKSNLDLVRVTEAGVSAVADTVTHSIPMRSESGTVRWITTKHGN